MEPFLYREACDVESSHWWFRVRREILAALIAKHVPPKSRLLDIGCGTGYIAEALRNTYEVDLMDASPEAVRICRQKGFSPAVASVQEIPFADNTFHLVCCFDVLYHRLSQPVALAFREIHRVLREDGCLILTEPAFSWLRGDGDILDHGDRRFTRSELEALLAQAGFRVAQAGYFNTFLFLPILMARFYQFLARCFRKAYRPMVEFKKLPAAFDRVLAGVFRLEKRIVLGKGFPFGVSVLCIAKK